MLHARCIACVVLLGALAGAGCAEATNPAGDGTGLSLTCLVEPSSGTAPLPVSLQVNAQGAQSITLSIEWGDGASSIERVHTYVAAGTYTVRATASRPGENASCTQNVSVFAAPVRGNRTPIFQSRVVPNPAVGLAPFEVNFNMCATSDPDGDPLLFTYAFGDGRQAQVTSCRHGHTYKNPGAYLATICATDGFPGGETCAVYDVLAQ